MTTAFLKQSPRLTTAKHLPIVGHVSTKCCVPVGLRIREVKALWMFLDQPPRGPHERRRLQKDAHHFMISRINSPGVVGKQRPSANSTRDSLISATRRLNQSAVQDTNQLLLLFR